MARNRGTARSSVLGMTLLALCLVVAGCVKGSATSNTAPSSHPAGGSGGQSGTYTSPPGGPTTGPTTAGGAGKGDYLGCHEFCMQAGGLGGGEIPSSDDNISISTSDIVIIDGMLPVTVTCTRNDPCQGWILVSTSFAGNFVELGRSDLSVPGRSTRVIAVMVANDALQKLNEAGKAQAQITVDYGYPVCPSTGCVITAGVTVLAQ